MIKAYLAGIPSLYEGEDIEIRYTIFEGEESLCKKSVRMEYAKPVIVGQVALMALLKELKPYADKEIVIIINDPALYEFMRGTSATKNKDVLKIARQTKKEWVKFKNCTLKNIGNNSVELSRWDEVLKV